MIHIKKFIDTVSYLESRQGKDLVMSANDARMLRDEIAKLLADKVTVMSAQTPALIPSIFYPDMVLTGPPFK